MTATPPSQTPTRDDAPPLELIERQVAICIDLERRAAEILEALARDEDVAPMLADRQPLIDELKHLDGCIATACPSWSAYLGELPPAQQRSATERVSRREAAIKRVRTIDAVLMERLDEARSEVSAALSELVKTRHSNRAYVTGSTSASTPGKNRFMDARG